ncbi:MAG: DUF6702 family protein [Litorimonas sp.]
MYTKTTLSKRKFLAASAAGFCSSLLLTTPALAHRAARTETQVTLHEDGRVDIIHLMHTDDTKRALHHEGIIDKPNILGLKARAQVALYVSEHFALYSNDTPVELDLIGAEIEGPNVYIYQEGRYDSPVDTLSINANMLRELIGNQTNSVNIKFTNESGPQTRSLDFKGRDKRKNIFS